MLFVCLITSATGKDTVMRLNKSSTKKGLRNSRLGCPLTNNRTPWCYGLCTPDEDKKGYCGRISPHALKGRTSTAIEGYKKRNHRLIKSLSR